LKDVDMDEMVLLHENDSHFNLVVNKESDLAAFGSLSYRFKDVSTGHEKENKDIENTIILCKESQYIHCEKELRLKTEEVEILKVELKDIRKMPFGSIWTSKWFKQPIHSWTIFHFDGNLWAAKL
jgi:hypothetical protein